MKVLMYKTGFQFGNLKHGVVVNTHRVKIIIYVLELFSISPIVRFVRAECCKNLYF